MNGRVYDPATAQFFSPDPFVQSPDNWQNYNRYAYCLNNPVMYTDPSGYQYDYVEPEPVEIRQTDMPGGGYTGFRENFNFWSAHQGSITYNDVDGKFYYSGGAEASWEEARSYLYSGSQVYYYSQGQQAIDFYKTTPLYLNGRRKAEATLKRQLANIDASGKNKISKPNWAISALGLITLDVTTPDPSDVVWQKWVVEGVVGAAALTYLKSGEIYEKMQGEISGIRKHAEGPQGFQYALVATDSRDYPNVRGGTTYLNAGDVWKYGETTKGEGRYSQYYYESYGLKMIPQFSGNQIEIKIQEKIMIYNYFFINGTLPPGNKIFR